MEHEIIYVKRKISPDDPESVEFVVSAVGLRDKSGQERLIPHPFGNRSTVFGSLEQTIQAIHRAGYSAEIEGQLYSLPSQKAMTVPKRLKPTQSATFFDTVTPTLIQLLSDATPSVVASAAFALGELKTPLAIEPLLDCFSHEDSTVRKHVSEAMAKIGAPAVESVRRALSDKNYLVRLTAITTIGEFLIRARPLGTQLLEDAKPLLMDSNWIVKSQTAHLVGQAAHLIFGESEGT